MSCVNPPTKISLVVSENFRKRRRLLLLQPESFFYSSPVDMKNNLGFGKIASEPTPQDQPYSPLFPSKSPDDAFDKTIKPKDEGTTEKDKDKGKQKESPSIKQDDQKHTSQDDCPVETQKKIEKLPPIKSLLRSRRERLLKKVLEKELPCEGKMFKENDNQTETTIITSSSTEIDKETPSASGAKEVAKEPELLETEKNLPKIVLPLLTPHIIEEAESPHNLIPSPPKKKRQAKSFDTQSMQQNSISGRSSTTIETSSDSLCDSISPKSSKKSSSIISTKSSATTSSCVTISLSTTSAPTTTTTLTSTSADSVFTPQPPPARLSLNLPGLCVDTTGARRMKILSPMSPNFEVSPKTKVKHKIEEYLNQEIEDTEEYMDNLQTNFSDEPKEFFEFLTYKVWCHFFLFFLSKN